jgi:hypothetical protein
MDRQDKKKIGIGVAIVAGIVLLFFVGKWFITRQAGEPTAIAGNDEEKEKKVEQAQGIIHVLCRYADSVGIDTSRYSVKPTSLAAEIDDKRAGLLMEIRYGKKPSRLAFSGLKEKVDSAWAPKADAANPIESVAKLTPFGPYNQLVAHYNRIRRGGRSNALTTDSLRLIRQTLNFYRYTNRFDADKFVVVNIPAAELNVFDRKGTRLLPMDVIVGKPDRQTPSMTTYVQNVVAYPYWNVPRKIALEEVLPRMQKNISYLYNQNFQIIDEKEQEVDPEEVDWESLSATNFPYRIRQASGCENSLGLLKFVLANPLAIYLHDTNSRDLFTQSTNRWRSHGCVRVQKPVELANLVLGAQTFTPDFMNKCLIDQKPRQLAIPKQVPVFIAYNIADVDAGGKLTFYKDVYSLDK